FLQLVCLCAVFFLDDIAPLALYPLSLHDALPILQAAVRCGHFREGRRQGRWRGRRGQVGSAHPPDRDRDEGCRDLRRHGREHHQDRKSTRLNSSHVKISYAVFCLKKKRKEEKSTY